MKKRLSILVAESIATFFGQKSLFSLWSYPFRAKDPEDDCRPRYRDQIITGKNITQTYKMAEDRQEWKVITDIDIWNHDA